MNDTMTLKSSKLNTMWWMLRLAYGLVPILAGLDKFGFDYIVYWPKYFNPDWANALHITVTQGTYIVGIIEVIAGLLVLSKWTRFGAYLVAFWLVLISINLVTMYTYYDIAIRDIVMSLGALSLAWLTEMRHLVYTKKESYLQ